MSNAITGNFDTCLEITRSALANAASSLVQTIPNDIVLPLTVISDTTTHFGTFHALFSAVEIVPERPAPTAEWPAAVALTLGFRQSAIKFPAAAMPDSASPLQGRIRAAPIPISLAPPALDESGILKRNVVIHFDQVGGVTVSIQGGSSDERRIRAHMEELGLDVADALDAIERAARAEFTRRRPFSAPGLAFAVAPAGQDGQFNGPVFADVVLTSLPEGIATMPALNVLGTILSSHLANDDPSAKTEAVTVRPNTVSLTVAPEAFRDLFFCPGALRALLPYYLKRALPGDFLARLPPAFVSTLPPGAQRDLVETFVAILPPVLPRNLTAQLPPDVAGLLPQDVADLLSDTVAAQDTVLPPVCGHSEGIHLPFCVVDSIRGHLDDGFIAIHGTVKADQAGMHGTGTFSSRITLALVNGQLQPDVSPPDVDLNISFDWWVYVLGTLAGGFPAAILAGVNELIKHFATCIAKATLENQLTQLEQPLPLNGLLAATPVSVTIQPRGIVVQGTTPPPPRLSPPTFPELRFSVSGSRTDVQGPEQVARDVGCLHRDYRYRELAVTTQAVLSTVVTGLPAPITYAWTVGGIALRAELGVVGGDDREFALTYSLSPDRATLTLANVGRGNSTMTVECIATDSSGLQATATTMVSFVGHDRKWEPQYTEDIRQCIMGAVDDLRGAAAGPLPRGGDPVALRDRATTLIAGRGGLRRLDPLIIYEMDALLQAAGLGVDWLTKLAALHHSARRRLGRRA